MGTKNSITPLTSLPLNPKLSIRHQKIPMSLILQEAGVSEPKGPDIFAYTDYRQFMKDFFAFMKSTKPFFSYQYFASSYLPVAFR